MQYGSTNNKWLQPTSKVVVGDNRVGAWDDHGQEKPEGDDLLDATVKNAVPIAATSWAQAVSLRYVERSWLKEGC